MPEGRLYSLILTTGCQTASLRLTKLVVTIYVIKRFQVFLPLNVVFLIRMAVVKAGWRFQ